MSIRIVKPDEPPFVICYCDGCNKREEYESEEAALFNGGWTWKGKKFYCSKCTDERGVIT